MIFKNSTKPHVSNVHSDYKSTVLWLKELKWNLLNLLYLQSSTYQDSHTHKLLPRHGSQRVKWGCGYKPLIQVIDSCSHQVKSRGLKLERWEYLQLGRWSKKIMDFLTKRKFQSQCFVLKQKICNSGLKPIKLKTQILNLISIYPEKKRKVGLEWIHG